ncbi:hypothetical protein B296_00010353 [Ensete ventricosum]|uniref:DOG1 domain-containing protein n=1 Tax=Ensete ventricosum TaxID=4639 RepID=A0A426ZJA9_ENSVE|nr:hypothetical protein B296_00010353 [Ensete ventricosum]
MPVFGSLLLTRYGLHIDEATFDMEYARWLEEHHRLMCELRRAVQEQSPENELRMLVDICLAHYDQMMHLKGAVIKSDVFHLISGMWMTPAERCFMWMGGFRPSELIKMARCFALLPTCSVPLSLPGFRLLASDDEDCNSSTGAGSACGPRCTAGAGSGRSRPSMAAPPWPAVNLFKFYPADDVNTPIPNCRKPKPAKLRPKYTSFSPCSFDFCGDFLFLV